MACFTYHLRFEDGTAMTVAALAAAPPELPDWTALSFHQCPNCPLGAGAPPRCPMAVAFLPLVELFGQRVSHEQVIVRVEAPERSTATRTTLQRAVGSLMGLLAATNGCPRVDFLAPMAHFHLPFSSEQETIYRVASSYLLAQYFAAREGGLPDWQFDGLKAAYQELQQVNKAMAGRLRAVSSADGTVNALILLDLLAKALPGSIDDALVDVREIFGLSGSG